MLQEWISCSQQLPQDREVVLVWSLSTNSSVVARHYKIGNNNLWSDGTIGVFIKVTHWMPLPEKPE